MAKVVSDCVEGRAWTSISPILLLAPITLAGRTASELDCSVQRRSTLRDRRCVGVKAPYFHRSWVNLSWATSEDELRHRLTASYRAGTRRTDGLDPAAAAPSSPRPPLSMINQPPESRFAGLLNPFFDGIRQILPVHRPLRDGRSTPINGRARASAFVFAKASRSSSSHARKWTRLPDNVTTVLNSVSFSLPVETLSSPYGISSGGRVYVTLPRLRSGDTSLIVPLREKLLLLTASPCP
jgi:hypothetical protein